MQNKAYSNHSTVASTHSSVPQRAQNGSLRTDELTRIFNTALVSSQATEKRNFSAELREVTESAAFRTILNAVRQLASVQGMNESQAAEEVISTFRKMDEIWSEYIFREGIDRVRGPRK